VVEGGGAEVTPAVNEGPASSTNAISDNKTREDFELGTHAGVDDDALAAKMRRASERLEGLDQHVADLRRRSEEQDAISKVREHTTHHHNVSPPYTTRKETDRKPPHKGWRGVRPHTW
jgi:hypothetical protein